MTQLHLKLCLFEDTFINLTTTCTCCDLMERVCLTLCCDWSLHHESLEP